jgi:hypothetical protein
VKVKKGRTPKVVDTNVLIVANGRQGEPVACRAACSQALVDIQHMGTLVIDDASRILDEYRRHCSLKGQPGMGDKFIKWVYDSIAKTDLLCQVAINETNGSFTDFPESEKLRQFDPSDRKFVAVSVAHGKRPPILHATDRGWPRFAKALGEHGISVTSLCPGATP